MPFTIFFYVHTANSKQNLQILQSGIELLHVDVQCTVQTCDQ